MCLQVLVSIERYLTGNLRDSPPDVEALRVFLTLPYCAAFSDPEHHMSIIVPFASALLKLQPKPRDVLGESDRAASAAFPNVCTAHENRHTCILLKACNFYPAAMCRSLQSIDAK